MKDEDLHKKSIDELFDLMEISIKQLVVLGKYQDNKNVDAKRKEVELIQRVIVAKAVTEMPGK